MATQFKLRRDTASNWTTANPTLAAGEPGVETDTNKLKIGNGTSPWNSLAYLGGTFDASAIISGTFDSARLPTTSVAKGGTGATDAGTARTNLGITPANIGSYTTAQVDSALLGKANSVHGHIIADVSGLQSAIDGKAASVHGHAIADVSGLQTALNGKQPAGDYQTALGFWPIPMGGGPRQLSNYVRIGWAGTGLAVSVDGSDQGNVAFQGNSVSFGNIYSQAVYNTSVTYGAYRAVWVNADGTLGQTASSRTVKQDIEPTTLDTDAVLDVEVVNFRYIDAVEALGDEAPVEVGVIAEQLLEIGLDKFVYFNEDGSPAGVHYERLAVAIIPQLQAQAARLDAVEASLAALEK